MDLLGLARSYCLASLELLGWAVASCLKQIACHVYSTAHLPFNGPPRLLSVLLHHILPLISREALEAADKWL